MHKFDKEFLKHSAIINEKSLENSGILHEWGS